jgi:protein ImuB
MSLWLCLRFDALPLEALLKQPESQGHRATVVVAQRLVVACDDTARCAGVIPGQGATTAQALLTQYDAHIMERKPEKESALLQHLMTWAYGLSPHLERWQNNALMIEVGSCLTLHRGLEALLQRIHNEMSLRSLTVTMGVAETRTAAWLLSHCDAHLACQPEQPLSERLSPLPLTLLRDEFPTIVDRLEKAGIRQFAQLLDIPLADIGKRCGITFVDWLNQLLGRRQEPTINYQPPTRFQDTLWFGFDIRNRQELHPAMKQLLLHFCHFLVNTQLTSGVIEWHCLRPRGRQGILQGLL